MRNCVIYLLKNAEADINNINKSLSLLMVNFLPFNNCDILIFHEKGLNFDRIFNLTVPQFEIAMKFAEVNLSPPNYPGWIKELIPEYFPHPYANVVGHSGFGHKGFDTGYRGMCRFFSGAMYEQRILKDYDYYLRLDSDSFILSPVNYNIFEWARENKCYYGFLEPAVQQDHPAVIVGLHAWVKNWLGEKNIPTRVDIDSIQEGRMYYTNFELGKLSWFRESCYKGFFEDLDASGRIFALRYGDAPIKYLAVNLFMNKENIIPVHGIKYQHGAIYST